ncbi:MAG: right-handed parallel beta-helix repeat-containing protein [Flavobacteriales bacterium]|nr:right-handed parallel beta-helix repeat-containing protein [Flavobacteriales bacterium]
MSSLLFAAISSWTYATDYYVAPNGNDGNNGTSAAAAWSSIARVNQSAFGFQPGDRILFKRGGTWRGELILGSSGTPGQPITVGAYGTGAKPIIKGSETVSGWTVHQGSIWKCTVTAGKVIQLYAGGERMTPARFPNSGWLRNDQGGGNQLQSDDLTQPSGYWNDAVCVLRSSNWSFDTLRVASHNGETLQFTSGVTYLENNPWGFYLRGKLSELDSPGEWFYDPASQQLYLWPLGSGNPNSLTVEAAIHQNGINCYWQRSNLKVQDLEFRHQTVAGIRNDGANNVTVSGCTFRDLYHGISSAGQSSKITGNEFRDTYATAAFLLDNNALIEGNDYRHIAMLEGEGESSWGYFGIRAIGNNVVIRGNRLDSIGYIGINAEQNTLVERNVVLRSVALLNDGGSIAIDHADGMIIQDNIVGDPIGRMDNGVAMVSPYFENMTMGIYFGNTSIKNTVVQRNTVYGCHGAGIHVDHTMVTSGIQVKDNVLYNNKIQITLSDYSNNVGTGATPPYHVPQYNDVYSGNVMYCLTKDQLCMRQYHVYGSDPVDFGTYTNNSYFNPYNELSIEIINFASGNRTYTLERWQADRNEDAGSTRSPLRQAGFTTTDELSANLVQNGQFSNNVNGWSGWPTNAQVSRVTNYLDNGALKAYLPNNSMYPSFTMHNPDLFPIQNSAWYRVRCSLQSNANGQLILGIKGQSTSGDPYTTWQQEIPFSTERRDLELYFQSTLSDQAWIQFTNLWTDPMYYLDNVEVTRVNVQPANPQEKHLLLVNDQSGTQTVALPEGCWSSVGGEVLQGQALLPAMSSLVIYLLPDDACGLTTTVPTNLADAGPGAIHPNPAQANGPIRFGAGITGHVTLFNMQGAEAWSATVPMGGELVLPALPAGMYMAHLQSKGGPLVRKLIVH